jgi:D-alanine-D-alanine ligase
MRICLLTDQELDVDPFPEDDWPCDPRPFLPDAEWELVTLWKEYAVAQIIEASHKKFDLFFNLCDGAWDEGRVGVEVVQTLERLNLPFTGATSDFFEPSREVMKRVCRAWGIDTPAYVLAQNEEDMQRALDLLRFPLFVKHPNSYASNGLTRESRVTTASQLRERAGEMIRQFGTTLIEEFIEGNECTVLVAENPDDPARPITYQPIQYRFPEGETFKHYDMKWVEYDALHAFPVEDPELDARLREASARFFVGIRGAGFGRCDIRVAADGRAFMLEINPNCGVYYPPSDPGSADLCIAHDPAGHEGFTRQIVAAGLRRHERRQRNWEVLPKPGGDYGTFTTRALAAGERIVVFEDQPHHLVTRAHVEANWDERRKDWFARYAWPLTDEVWVTWSDDPDDWRPFNHSCDPTAWLTGLDVVARRPLARRDEITLDYATFYDERMPAFSCSCGAPECRRTVRGDDCLKDFVSRYGDHLSDHVRRKRTASKVRV